MPLSLVFIGLISGYLLRAKKTGKRLIIISILSLYLFSNQFIINVVLLQWEYKIVPMAEVPKHDFAIVLTGVVNLSKTTDDRTFFHKGADRITHTLQLYQDKKIDKILITGGQGFNPINDNTEAKLLKDFLLMAGVPQEAIIIEDKAKNTYQNAIFTKEILNELEILQEKSSFILVTSAFHMKRAKACFDKAGIKTFPFPTDYYTSDVKWDLPHLLYPDPTSIAKWHTLFKEIVGLIMYKIAGYI
ncbi:hypothetical protein GCM10008106_13570 [Mongoliitalea lutea]|uniref:DUF218 domain-containing protein n=2 Tax=Mongoliitalea lutea TaxID=849756 RepID=A0A8J3CXY2_9BACT|nr:hypothetical protein GCM10008106_13570 [Mongoliitalea lutea]